MHAQLRTILQTHIPLLEPHKIDLDKQGQIQGQGSIQNNNLGVLCIIAFSINLGGRGTPVGASIPTP